MNDSQVKICGTTRDFKLFDGMNEYQISRVQVTASIKWSSRVESSTQKWSSASRICEYILLNIKIFNVEYHAIIEIVESSRVE